MHTFRPAFSFWPRPRFLGDSYHGFTAWIDRRDAEADHGRATLQLRRIKRIIEAHHDRHARTIETAR